MAAVLEAKGLGKYFRHNWTMRRFQALQDLDLRVDEGEVFGLIGPNGAGKTTAFKVILGLLRPSAGTVTFRGQPLRASNRAEIGFLPEQPYFYDYLTVYETLDMYGRLYGLRSPERHRRVSEVIDQVQLGHKRRASLRTLSKGTLQRVGVAQAILNRPRLIILDEPMSGLDPSGRHHMRELVLSVQRDGATVIFSSHILPDAEVLCHRVGILAGGKLREVIDLRRDQESSVYLMTVTSVQADTVASLTRLAEGDPTRNGRGWSVRLGGPSAVGAALDIVRQAGGLVESLIPVHPSLEDRFLIHVGHESSLD